MQHFFTQAFVASVQIGWFPVGVVLTETRGHLMHTSRSRVATSACEHCLGGGGGGAECLMSDVRVVPHISV